MATRLRMKCLLFCNLIIFHSSVYVCVLREREREEVKFRVDLRSYVDNIVMSLFSFHLSLTFPSLVQTRLVSPPQNEQNYHIFYQILAGLTSEERS